MKSNRIKRTRFKKISEAKLAMAELMLELKSASPAVHKKISLKDYF